MATKILESTPRVSINNITVNVVPNSVSYTEGFGEDIYKTQSAGGLSTSVVYAKNIESAFSKIKFEMEPTSDNITLLRTWKINGPNNTLSITGNDIIRSFSTAALTSDYEVTLGADKVISVEFKAEKPA